MSTWVSLLGCCSLSLAAADKEISLEVLLLGKYARNSNFRECQAPTNASHGWRSVLAGREILRKGLSWTVGSGDKIRVWRDP
ncbi:hypothetical protein DY000_02046111 [Brassica cretica]|uniref:Secreted protein n=1 Tax=Brassica cretica TaxID=69181 RepID=A0ABQ7F7T0_BRACR|nr:hypothetical protein DY000_02046111 [Brassica cretica]